MSYPHLSAWYEAWAPVLGRVMLGAVFLFGATGKIPGTESFGMEVGMTAAAGVPLASLAVTLALILELAAGLALVIGWHVRLASFVLMLFTILLTLIFHASFATPLDVGFFMSHIGLIGGLLYVSVYGAQHAAVLKDPLPRG